ncbi:MAG TPA: ABC transporter ATP-binding protein [Chthoniobacter sp.]
MTSNPLLYLAAQLWRFSKGNRHRVLLYSAMFIVAGATPLFGFPWVWSRVIDVVQKEGINSTSLHHLLLLLLLPIVIQVVFWAVHGPARVLERLNAFKVRANYRKYLLQGIMTLPMDWHASHHSGDSIDKVEKGATALYEFSATSFEIIYALVQFVGSFAVLAYFSRSSALGMAAMVALTIFIVMYFDRILVRQYQDLNRAENSVSESVFDAISNISTIITLRVEKLVFNAICHKIDNPLGLFRKNNTLNESKWFLTNMCATLTTAMVLAAYFLGHAHDPQGVLAGNVYLLINYLDKLGTFFFKFAAMYGDILQRRVKVMNAEELTADFREENFADHILPGDWKTLSMEGLTFSYGSRANGKRHLIDINLEIGRGEKIAFVGKSGSGKTTLLKIMRDLHTPQALKLTVDGVHATEGFSGIARAITLVPQSPEIFATTVGNNITLGAEYDDDTVQRFLDMACFTDVVADLPRGLDSSINEKGVNLSGGQMQRLALTRGLLACENKDIVLLDEPTSSLDSATEMAVYRRIFAGFAGKTIISSVHRLHLLRLFDRVCFFEDGKMIATGSLDELLAQCTPFRVLWAEHGRSDDH